MSIIAAMERIAAAMPDRPALIHGGQTLTYEALARRVRAMAGQLARAGLGPGDAVGITQADILASILVSLALIRLGCRQVALPPRDPAWLRDDLARRLALVAIVGTAAGDAVGGAALVSPDIEATVHQDGPATPPPGCAELVLGTSGTTGRAKLVVADEALMVDRAAVLDGLGRVFLHRLGFDGNHGRRLTLRSLVSGGTEVLTASDAPAELVELVARHSVGRVHLQPQAVATLAATRPTGGRPWPPGARVFTTGTRIPRAFRLDVQAVLGPVLYVQYGATEAGMVSLAGPADHAGHADSVGRLYPGVQAEAVDEQGHALPCGEEGILRFRSSGTARGYLDDAAADARFFGDGWFRPGDVGRVSAEGELFIAGRHDDMMTLGVIKIFPAEIEAVAEGFPGLLDCAAFAVRSGSLGDIPVLAAVGGPDLDAAGLLAHCRARLGLRAPRKVVRVDALPRTATGKVLRKDLAAHATAGVP